MAVYGIVDSQYIDVSPNIDLNYLQKAETADGVTFDALIPLVNAPLQAYNRTIPAEIAEISAPATVKVSIKGRGTGAFEVNRNAEYDVERPQRPGKPFAHGLAIWANSNAMEWTEDGLRNMTAEEVVAEVEEALNGFRLQNKHDVWARVFDPVEVPVDDQDLTTMVSPGFAGSGTGANAFQLTHDPRLKELGANYSHYWATTAANLAAALKAMVKQHRRWFPTGNLELVGSADLTALIQALGENGGFIRAERAYIREGLGNTVATVDGARYLGVFDADLLIRKPTDEWTDKNGFIFAPLGNLNARNPIVCRYSPKWGRGAYLRSRGQWPLEKSVIIERQGWNVNNRVGMELLRVDPSATYAPPAGFSALG